MKTVKLIFKAIVLLTILSLTSCSSDDDNDDGPGATVRSNTFSIAASSYSSPKVYLVIEGSGTTYDSEYQFIFGDSKIRLDASDNLSVETDASGIVAIKAGDDSNIVASMQEVVDQITVASHSLESSSAAFDNITSWANTYMYNSQEFGQPDTADVYQIDTAITSSIEIESVSFDVAAGTGIINCSYSYTSDTNSVIVHGEYAGTFEIIN